MTDVMSNEQKWNVLACCTRGVWLTECHISLQNYCSIIEIVL